MEKIITINEIIKNCGGVSIISEALGVHVTTPDKWRRQGVHDKYWCALMVLSNTPLSPSQIYNANTVARAANENHRITA